MWKRIIQAHGFKFTGIKINGSSVCLAKIHFLFEFKSGEKLKQLRELKTNNNGSRKENG